MIRGNEMEWALMGRREGLYICAIEGGMGWD
jgi:hypothetical protein